MSKRFIDFKTLRQSLDAHTILARYSINIARQSGDQFSVHCPFHEDKRPSMGVNADKRVFKCHACGTGGNLLDLVTMLEGHDPKTSDGIRKGAEVASGLVGLLPEAVEPVETGDSVKADKIDRAAPAKPPKANAKPKSQDAPLPASDPPAVQNKKLNFTLQLSPDHPELERRGFARKTYEAFGVGYAKSKRGMMKNRICFPLRDAEGDLIGYAGRWAEGEPPEDTARYLFPAGLAKSQVLWGWDYWRTLNPSHVVIVEGFWSVLRLFEAGVPAVSCFGHQLSDAQIELLLADGVEEVTLIFDGDEAGRAGANRAAAALAKRLWVRSIPLEEGVKPDTMADVYLTDLPRLA